MSCDYNHDKNNLIICATCDSMAPMPTINAGDKLVCLRCGNVLVHRKRNSVNRTFALSLAGLLCIVPACVMPIMGVGKFGFYHQASLIDCINLLLTQHYYIAAFSVFAFTLAVPLLRLISAFYLTYQLRRGQFHPRLTKFFRWYVQLNSWAMLPVFMLGIIISMYKIVDLAELTVGFGLFSLILMLLASTLIVVSLDEQKVWLMLERATG